MPITEQIKRQIRDAFNEALSDFNNGHLGVIAENVDCNDSHNTNHYVIKCDDNNENMEYIQHWIKRIYERLHREMYRPLYPIVELEGYGDGAYTIELGYGIYGQEIPFIRNLGECDSDSDADEDDEWMDVYNVGTFERFCKNQPQLQKYADCTYYQCWGGGPEGGYLLYRTCETGWDDEVYRVNRTWGEPFTVERVLGATGIEVQEIATDTGTRIRIIQ
jgi:hypothetical protein